MSDKRNCLGFWFPLIEAVGLPVPKTEIVRSVADLTSLLDGEIPPGWYEFLDQLLAAAERIGYPCFLRTGHTSGKHSWKDTCHVPALSALGQHVFNLVEFSVICCVVGLPTEVWAVRELLPTEPVAIFPGYGDMPLCREFRAFVEGAEVCCIHPYWPWEAVERGCQVEHVVDWEDWDRGIGHEIPVGLREAWEKLCELDQSTAAILGNLASRAGRALGGGWSVDLLETARGWYVTDMAEAHRSWHWPGCSNAEVMGGI